MAFIHVINGLNGDIIKWREPELDKNITTNERVNSIYLSSICSSFLTDE
jgi:hypothetical protein